eukprot:2502946-Lingulodinium_polyedra.AAC.1
MAIVACSANVLTLDPQGHRRALSQGLVQTAKMAVIQRQLKAAAVTFCGIQESRTAGSEIRPMSDYTAITSGATSAGTHGCELWFITAEPVQLGDKMVHLSPGNFSVFHASPTLLVVAASVGNM